MLISTGQPSTLGTYREIAHVLGTIFENSTATEYFDKMIAESPNGADEEVLAAESQMMYLILNLLGKA